MLPSAALLFFLLSWVQAASDTMFEGDILIKTDKLRSSSSPHMVLQDQSLAWMKGVVPFAFDDLSKFTDAEKITVREAMEGIEVMTGCIDFVEVDKGEGGDMVLITSRGFREQEGTGCWAHLGRQGGLQALNLGQQGCITVATVQHELLHTLGVVHEHNRPDRDEHVSVNLANVHPDKISNFIGHNWTEFEYSEMAYDYRSIMHYPVDAFAKAADLFTIESHHAVFQDFYGYSTKLSAIDAVEVAISYNCSIPQKTLIAFINENTWITNILQQEMTEKLTNLTAIHDAEMKAFKTALKNDMETLIASINLNTNSPYTAMDEMATAACTGLLDSKGYAVAVRRHCGTQYTCAEVCGKTLDTGPDRNTVWTCINSLHIYRHRAKLGDYNSNSASAGKFGPVIYKYNTCSRADCGPNYCCCTNA